MCIRDRLAAVADLGQLRLDLAAAVDGEANRVGVLRAGHRRSAGEEQRDQEKDGNGANGGAPVRHGFSLAMTVFIGAVFFAQKGRRSVRDVGEGLADARLGGEQERAQDLKVVAANEGQRQAEAKVDAEDLSCLLLVPRPNLAQGRHECSVAI